MTTTECLNQMREFAYWRGQQDALIREGLSRGLSYDRISETMGISKIVIRRVRKEDKGT
jgi:hypothetical protein